MQIQIRARPNNRAAFNEISSQQNVEPEMRSPVPRFLPRPMKEAIDPARTYRVALIPWTIGDYAKMTQSYPESFRLIALTLREALERNALVVKKE